MSTEASTAVYLLGIDTCGPTGSVALACVLGEGVEILDQRTLEGRTYSATLIAAVREVLDANKLKLNAVAALVVVIGPGSFTGVRVGLSAAKGLAEGAAIPLVAVSRLAVLAHASGCTNAALDAHRHEVFLRVQGREVLASASELAAMPAPQRVAVCDASAAALLERACPAAELLHMDAPKAADALRLGVGRFRAGEFDDVALLDGHYLRRSDAEIFGPKPA
jgi:tRNA threonylcarbamoyladenosine biosynthesis protein TsaB